MNYSSCKPSPGLYLIATPIGHLGDITLRALVTLCQADVIACEDTRKSGILLTLFGLKKPTISYHDHNADVRRPEILKRLAKGEVVALITDAGMPAIADPGFKLVRACREAGFSVTVIPGANAALTALTGSGLATDHFYFAGFLSPKMVARKKQIASLKLVMGTLIFYEAPQRLKATLSDLRDILGKERNAAVARELTKYYEDMRTGTLQELSDFYASNPVKGEIVILVSKSESERDENINIDRILSEKLEKMTLRDAVAEVVRLTGVSKKEIYETALKISKK